MTPNCINCGAPLAAVAGKAYLRCQYCSSLWFPQESDEGVRSLHAPTEHSCPVCTAPLAAGRIEDRPVAHCPECRGILTTTQEFYEIVHCLRVRTRGRIAPERPVDRGELSRVIACPGCGERMSVHPYYGPGNAFIDSCGECLLVWLDHSELTVLAAAHAESARRG